MAYQKRDDYPTVDLHPWPVPINERALRIIKTVLGAAMIVILLVQVVPGDLFGGMMNHFFTILLLLSWAGPARRMMRRYSTGKNNPAPEDPKADDQ